MLFVTNRIPDQGAVSSQRTISFDNKEVDISNSLFYCEFTTEGELKERMSDGFLGELKKSPRKNVLFYLHGYNTPFLKAVAKGRSLQQLLDRMEPDLAEVVTLVWPCRDVTDRVKTYWTDQDAADMAGPIFARVLSRFMLWRAQPEQVKDPCLKRIHVLAHSMGNRVLSNILSSWSQQFGGGRVPLVFRNVFMVAADVPSTTLERDQPGNLITMAARNVVVYYAGDDKRMDESILANAVRGHYAGEDDPSKEIVQSIYFSGDTRTRLGHFGPDDPERTRRNVYRLNCDQFNDHFDGRAGHSYLLTDEPDDPKGSGFQVTGNVSPVLRHVADAIRTGQVAADGQRAGDLKFEPEKPA
jgi:hypothetical protein